MSARISESRPSPPDGPGILRRRGWLIVGVLFLIQVTNFTDKTVLALAAPHIMAELGLSPARYGLIASAFFSLYALAGLFVGFVLAPRFRPRTIIVLLVLIWSVSQLPIFFAASFGTLLGCRMILGAGEGGATPTSVNAAHEWFPSDQRNLPTAVIMFGSVAGSLLAAPLLSSVIAAFGWRAAFLLCSLLGALVLLIWLLVGRDGPYSTFERVPADQPSESSGAVSQWDIWREPTVIGSLILGFCSYWIVGFTVAWLPPYLDLGLGFGQMTVGWVLATIYAGQAAIMLGVSAWSQRLLRQGVSSRRARGQVNGACMLFAAVSFAALALLRSPVAGLVLMALAIGFPMLSFTLNPALLSEIAPDDHRNRLINVMLAAITVAAMISPGLAGRLIERGNDGWSMVFGLNALVCLIGAGAAFALLHPERAKARFAAVAVARAAAP